MRAVRRVPNTRQEEAANLLLMEHLMNTGPNETPLTLLPIHSPAVPTLKSPRPTYDVSLKHTAGFPCTTSVFAPESGLPPGVTPSKEGILDMLDLHKDSNARKVTPLLPAHHPRTPG